MAGWSCVLELDSRRETKGGDVEALCDAVRGGADLRVGTAFRHNEHIDTTSSSSELIREVMDFRVTYLIEDRWVAGIENMRMPIALPEGFGPRPSMSLFLYNQDGRQAIARPHLAGQLRGGEMGPSEVSAHDDMPKYHETASWDADTNAPSSNFVYDFEYFRYFVRADWKEVLAHNSSGKVEAGSVDALAAAFESGCEVKVAIAGLCDDFSDASEEATPHEVFLHMGACYYYTDQKLFMASANPVVRTRATIPLGYGSRTWDFGWLMPRTDGHLARWLCDPYTLKFEKSTSRHAMRWFVNGLAEKMLC